MAIHTLLLRLLPLLLLLLPPHLRDYLSAGSLGQSGAAGGRDGQLEGYHPIVLFPGVSCSDLEARLTDAYTPSLPRCGALKGKGWFPLWNNTQDIIDNDYVSCFEEQMSLVYDPVLGDYRNLPGVETRVTGFGSAHGFTSKNDGIRNVFCMIRLREKLEALGYQDRDTLFGAPYDPRHVPPSPGRPSKVYSDYFARVKNLVQHASKKNQNKPVILIGHSFGGMVLLEFVNWTPLLWKKQFIKHLVLISPAPYGGFLQVVTNLASGPTVLVVPTVSRLGLRPMWRTFASSVSSLPSPTVFGHKPLVITNHRNYSAYDYKDFLAVLGFNNEVVKRLLPMKPRVDAPMLPTTYLNGVGVETPEQVVYKEGNFDVAPENIYGDGDGVINLVSVLGLVKELRKQQRRNNIPFKFVKIVNATHSNIVVEEPWLKRVMAEILEANY